MINGAFGTLTGHADVRCGLPPPPIGPENSAQWYHDAMQLPETRVAGWFGAVIGNGANRGNEVQLLWFDGDHLAPKVRMVIDQTDLIKAYIGLGKLIGERLGA